MNDDITIPPVPATRPTILQVLPRLVTGGVERGTVEVATAIVNAGWTAVVASEGGPMVPEIERAGAKHITLPLASKNPYVMWRNIERLAELIDEYAVDIVHVRSRAPAWSAYFAARTTDKHFVTTFHNAYAYQTPFKQLYNSVMAKGERVIAISNFVSAYVQRSYGVSKDRLRIIPRGVDSERFDRVRVDKARIEKLKQEWQIADGQPVILLPGRLTRWKGQSDFIDAIALMKQRNVTGLIAGSGDAGYHRELQDAIDKHGLHGNVRLVDECRDMPAALCIADIVVSASTRPEGFGRVIVEAQAMGCIVIATQHGGAAETVRDQETGYLVPPSNAAKLAETLDKVLALSADERKTISQKGIAHVRTTFTTDLMTKRTLAVYEEILKTP